MAVHRFHPDPARADDPEAILWDDCERCDEHTEHPHATLDKNNIINLWRRMVDKEFYGRGHYRSEAEARASHELMYIAVFLQRVSRIDPDEVLG